VAMTTPPPAMEVLPWQRFGEAARDLARTVHASGWMPDLVIAVARGGLVPAGAIASARGVKAMGTRNVELSTAGEATRHAPVVLPPLLDTTVLSGAKVLVVDDVADSGRTLQVVMNLLREGTASPEPDDATAAERPAPLRVAHLPSEARSAVLYTKPRSII